MNNIFHFELLLWANRTTSEHLPVSEEDATKTGLSARLQSCVDTTHEKGEKRKKKLWKKDGEKKRVKKKRSCKRPG